MTHDAPTSAEPLVLSKQGGTTIVEVSSGGALQLQLLDAIHEGSHQAHGSQAGSTFSAG
jgi:hypothetical protein